MSEKGYYRVESASPNIYATASLAEIIEQLESCEYRCEAGPLRLNLAFIELKERAEQEVRKGEKEYEPPVVIDLAAGVWDFNSVNAQHIPGFTSPIPLEQDDELRIGLTRGDYAIQYITRHGIVIWPEGAR